MKIETTKANMPGNIACGRLDKVLAEAGIIAYSDEDGPMYRVFES